MECAWQTLRTFSQNHKQLQGSPGAVAVLHTHSRRLDFHPNVHVAMPAGALDAGTPTPRANPGAPLGPCLAMRQAGREAQGDGFYSRSPNLRFRMRGGCASGIRLPPSPDALPCLPPGDACLVRRMVPASWLVFISSNRRTQGFALARHCELPVSALPILYTDHESGAVFKKVILRVAQDDSY